jgi:uncharacterized protein
MTETIPHSFDWNSGPLAEGLRCYRAMEFWNAHEHWESVWLTLSEPEKSFLQALIQVSAAFHHLQTDNRRGAISLLGRALLRLDRSSPEFCGVNVALLRDQARQWHTALTNETQLPASFPAFSMIEA